MMWNLQAAVIHLRANAQPKPIKECGRYTRQAIEAGGLTLTQHRSAKDYGSSLLAVGFGVVNTSSAAFPNQNQDFVGALKGDVAVMADFTDPNPPPGYASYYPDGHMQMYDGASWISDFKQRTFYPGPPYRRAAPDYVIYRFAVTAVPQPNEDSPYSLIPDSPYSWLPDFGTTPSAPSAPAAPTTPTAVAPAPPSQTSGNKYVVKTGDSLGIIALNAWNDALLWPLIHDDNYSTIGADANRISPNTELVIRDLSGLSAADRAATRERGRSW